MNILAHGAPIDLEQLPFESTPQPRRPRYYAVAIGHTTGVFTSYDAAEPHVAGHPYGRVKKFKALNEANAYVEKYRQRQTQISMQNSPAYQNYPNAGEPSYQDWETTRHDAIQPLQPAYDAPVLSYAMQPLPRPEPLPALTNHNTVPVDTGPPLVLEQQRVVDLILAGRNVFYTGSAGSGKSTILKSAVRQLQQRGKRVKIVAPTNLAALNVGGVTTWSYAGWTVQSMKRDIDKLMKSAMGDKSWARFDETDVLIIDEISMIENLFFERMNMVIKASRGEKYGGGPFGGMQLIVTGDVRSSESISNCLSLTESVLSIVTSKAFQ